MTNEKRCNTCSQVKPLTEFHRQPNSPDGLKYRCKSCAREYAKDHYAVNRERVAAGQKAWYEQNRERISQDRKAWHQARKREVIDHYGGRCACCGERTLAFLTLDHVNSDGAQHRRELGHGRASSRIYTWARQNDYPDVLQVLCMNCNCGRQWNGGICPHQENP